MKLNSNWRRPIQGESVHSFIYRTLFLLGYTNFKSVITSGGWRRNSTVPIEAAQEFVNYDADQLFNLYEDNIAIEVGYSLFSDPFLFVKRTKPQASNHSGLGVASFSEVFFPTKDRSGYGNCLPVRFCIDCIQEQVKYLGFSYFKAEWNYQGICGLHNKPLFEIDGGLCANSIKKQLEIVRRGELPQHSTKVCKNFKEVSSNSCQRSNTKIAPCAVEKLSQLIYRRKKAFPTGYTETVDYGYLNEFGKEIHSNFRYKQKINSAFESFYEASIENDYNVMINFIKETMELIEVQYSNSLFSISGRWVLKNIGSNCFHCNRKCNNSSQKCSASQLIHKNPVQPYTYPLKLYTYRGKRYMDIPLYQKCEKMLDDLDTEVFNYQDNIGVKEGEKRVDNRIKYIQRVHEIGCEIGGSLKIGPAEFVF